MENTKNIYLVGFMGTGKSVVAAELAKKLNRKSVDIDGLIEEREVRKINDIFIYEGEIYFRKIEKELLSEVSNSKGLVVSCGGGIVLDEQNIKIMKQTGVIICLTARPEVILDRAGSSTHRPLLNVDNPAKKIEELLKLRAPFYAKADYIVDSSDMKIRDVTDTIIKDILPRC